VAGRAGCQSFPWRSARARRAREARRDQYQVIETLGFRLWNSGESRLEQADRQQFPAWATVSVAEFWEVSEELYVLDTF